MEFPKTVVCKFLHEDGRKILVVAKVNGDGKDEFERFSVDHLLDENLEVTEQTMNREKEMFKPPIEV